MKLYLVVLFLILGTYSKAQQQERSHHAKCDSNYKISLEGFSSEGGEGIVCIRHHRIIKAMCTLYAETGKEQYHFICQGDSISIDRMTYAYSKPLTEVKSNKDIRLTSRRRYVVSRKSFTLQGEHKGDAALFSRVMASYKNPK